jgi:hypothetical protein
MSCHVCLDGPCDSEYHASVRRIRQWMIRGLDAAPPVIAPRTFAPSDVLRLGLPTVEQRKRASRLGGRARGRR